ncbi:EamA family transporter [Chloroflexota bacterium]
MNPGIWLALGSAGALGVSAIATRKGSYYSGESISPVAIDLTIGTLIMSGITFASGKWGSILSLSPASLWLLIGAGVIHFIFGRFLNYTCIRIIGANRATAIFRTQILYAIVFGILLLNEPLTIHLITGAICIATGATIAVSNSENHDTGASRLKFGIISGLAGSFFWGISSVMIRPAIAELGSPYIALFVSISAAFVCLVAYLLATGRWRKFRQLPKISVIAFCASGFLTTLGNILRYAALFFIAASVVVPILSISAIFTVVFSRLINRDIEVFSVKLVGGILLTVAGTYLVT